MRVLLINLEPNLDFFTKKGLTLDITYDTYDKIFPAIKSGTTTNTDGSPVTLYSPDVRQYLEENYKDTKYDVILFGWDSSKYGDEFRYSGGQTFRDALTNGSRFATVRIGTPNAEIHEMMHIIGNILYIDMKKYDAVDQMDATTVNGKTYYYYKNDTPDAIDGNFAITWNSYKKYLPELNKTMTTILKLGYKGEAVKELQKLLGIKADGEFGVITQKIVKAFQRSRKLVADGIVGEKTFAELKKKPSINLSSWKLDKDFEKLCMQLLEKCEQSGYKLKITHGLRTIAEQDKLYAQGRTLSGRIVTNARGGQSKHNFGKAIDVAFQGSEPYPKNFDWEKIGNIGEKLGLKWGGRFSIKDFVHFEI